MMSMILYQKRALKNGNDTAITVKEECQANGFISLA